MLLNDPMRHLLQLLIPALIFIAVVFLALRSRRSGKAQATAEDDNNVDSGMFILILVIGAMVTVGVVLALQSFWAPGP